MAFGGRGGRFGGRGGGGRGRGRGGGRGHGRGGGHDSRGPQLPQQLVKELAGSDGGHASRGRGRGASRKNQRKAERDAKKQKRVQHQQFHREQRQQNTATRVAPQGQKRQRDADGDLPQAKRAATGAAPAQKLPQQQKPKQAAPAKQPAAPAATARAGSSKPPKTYFHELLLTDAAGRNDADAFLEDLKLQRQLEKRLGVKKGSSALAGPDDGLGGFVKGLDAGTKQLLPKYMQGRQGDLGGEEYDDGRDADRAAGGASRGGRGTDRDLIADSDDDDSLGMAAAGSEDMEDDEDDGDLMGDLDDLSDEGEGASDDASDEGEGASDDGSDGDLGDEDEEEGASEDDDEDDMYDMYDDDEHGHELYGTDDDDEDEEGDEAEDSDGGDDDDDDHMLASGSDEGEEEDEQDEKEPGDGDGDDDGDDDGDGDDDALNQRRASSAAAGTSAAPAAAGAYVPPALRAKQAAAAAGTAALERRVTGLVNRLAEANLQGIVKDVVALYAQDRATVGDTLVAQIMGAVSRGPRASEQFAAVAVAFVAALSGCLNTQELAAKFLAAVATGLEAALEEKDSLACHNLVLVIACASLTGLVGPILPYSLLDSLRERFGEEHVQLIVTLLSACGLQLRGADPVAMKEFVLAVHSRAAEAGAAGTLSKRARLMLDLVVDIKNNRQAAAKNAAGGKAASVVGGSAAAVLGPSVTRWLRDTCKVEDVALRSLTWAKLLTPNKKGMWWLPLAGEAMPGRGAAGGQSLMEALGMDGGEGGEEAAALLSLAAAQRMNTDVRRAVFCAVMGSEDVVEAHEKLCRLPLKGDQEREVIRVLVDCACHEKSWNPYYALLAVKLCQGSKAHRLTAQYCMWDQYKALDGLDTRQLAHTARLNALLVARFCLSLTSVKVVDFSRPLSTKALFFWRVFFQQLLGSAKNGEEVREHFSRVAAQGRTAQGAALVSGLLLFLRTQLGPWLATRGGTAAGSTGDDADELLRRVRAAEKVLAAAAAAAPSGITLG